MPGIADFRFLCQLVNDSQFAMDKPLNRRAINWHKLASSADRMLMTPALYAGLRRNTMLDCVPTDIRNFLEASYELNLDRNRQLILQVREVADVFQNHSIQVVLLKGIASLTAGLYDDIGTRIMRDLDILVAEKNIRQATQLLYDMAYTFADHLPDEDYPISLDEEFIADQHSHHLQPLCHKDKVGIVELHFALGGYETRKLLDAEQVLARSISIECNGAYLSVPDLAYRILHNFDHSQRRDNNHRYFLTKPRQLYDLTLLFNSAHALGVRDLQSNIHEMLVDDQTKSQFVAYLRRAQFCFGLPITSSLEKDWRSWSHFQIGLVVLQFPWLLKITEWTFIIKLLPGNVRARQPGRMLPVAYAVSLWSLMKRHLR